MDPVASEQQGKRSNSASLEKRWKKSVCERDIKKFSQDFKEQLEPRGRKYGGKRRRIKKSKGFSRRSEAVDTSSGSDQHGHGTDMILYMYMAWNYGLVKARLVTEFLHTSNKSTVVMDEGGHRENGRHKNDQYKTAHTQWMMPQHQLKENQTIKLLMAEREKALQERDIAMAEKKAALVERDMAYLQRDSALAERNNVIIERDNAIAALEYARENCMSGNCATGCSAAPRGAKHIYSHQRQHLQHVHLPPQQSHDVSSNQTRETSTNEAFLNSGGSEAGMKLNKAKRSRKETKVQATSSKKTTKSPRKSKKGGGDDLNKQVTIALPVARRAAGEWRGEVGVGEDLNKQIVSPHEWKNQDLGLNQVSFDDLTMPVPVCSCTGKYQQCYKWGNGGWQSACCTMTLSMYPLPVMPNKRHARVAGRKMSGSVFRKLLSRLAAEGHDLSLPVDLKDHWAKHGTNRYITIK
ncbi:hypothetical protein Cni_G14456 [Canna indica]|uniref:GAGA-binding transcriptional activator n=1 Tax=Canna indica TaxID=4628 RepID=A0AAQ3KC40_9LILI|nr:hypothetical protein Cni_G14456 [Canna indica]